MKACTPKSILKGLTIGSLCQTGVASVHFGSSRLEDWLKASVQKVPGLNACALKIMLQGHIIGSLCQNVGPAFTMTHGLWVA